MNILHVIPSLDLKTGGPAYAIRDISRWQQAAGHQVAVLTTTVCMDPRRTSGELEIEAFRREEPFRGTELLFMPATAMGAWDRKFAFVPFMGRALNRHFRKKQQPDIVHIHATFSYLTMAAASWARRKQIPYVNRPCGSLDNYCLAQGRSWAKQRFLRWSYLPDLRRASMVHATSAAEREAIRNLVPEASKRIRVVPLGTNVRCCTLEQERRRFFIKHPELQGRRIVLYLSRITAKKRPEMLVKACAELTSRYPDIVLLFVGNGDSHETLLRKAIADLGMGESVSFLGHLDGKEKCEVFAAAELYALPSVDENFGIAVLEAMAHELPVVVTRGVATQKYVEESRGGVTVDDTCHALAEGIDAVLRDDADAYGKRGREYVERKLSWRATAQRLINEYERALPAAELRNHGLESHATGNPCSGSKKRHRNQAA